MQGYSGLATCMGLAACASSASSMPTAAQVQDARLCCQVQKHCTVETQGGGSTEVRNLHCEDAGMFGAKLNCTYERRIVRHSLARPDQPHIMFDWQSASAPVRWLNGQWCLERVKIN